MKITDAQWVQFFASMKVASEFIENGELENARYSLQQTTNLVATWSEEPKLKEETNLELYA